MGNFLINDNTFGSRFTVGDIVYTEEWEDNIPPYTRVKITQIVDHERVVAEILNVDRDAVYEDLCDVCDYEYEDEDDLWDRTEDIVEDLVGQSKMFYIEDFQEHDAHTLMSMKYGARNFLPIPEKPISPPKESFIFLFKNRAGGYTIMIKKKLISSKLMLKKKAREFRSRLSSLFKKKEKPIKCGAGLLNMTRQSEYASQHVFFGGEKMRIQLQNQLQKLRDERARDHYICSSPSIKYTAVETVEDVYIHEQPRLKSNNTFSMPF